jgi:hypothetical protein
MSTRALRQKNDKFHDNITKRGNVVVAPKKDNTPPVGPIVLGFFLFVVVGSALLQMIRTAF